MHVSALNRSELTSALAASRTWQSVMAGFFPPEPLGLAGQEQMTDQRDREVPHQSLILADFEMGEAQLALLVLQGAFDGPTREGNVQPSCELVVEWIPDQEPLLLVRVQSIMSPKEMVTAEDSIVATKPQGGRLDLPHHRSFVGVLDVEGSPFLLHHRPGVMTQFLDAAGGMLGLETGVREPAA